MPSYTKSEDSYRVSYITGPQHVLLGLRFDETVCNKVELVSLGISGACNHGELDTRKIRTRVMEGISKANTEFKTNYILGRIEYVENDSPNYSLYGHCAYLIVKALHEGIEFSVAKIEQTNT